MFKALFKGVPINLLSDQEANQRDLLKANEHKDQYQCPVCKESVRLNWAEPARRIPHFKHKPGTNCIYSIYGEGPMHIEGKSKLYRYFLQLLGHKTKTIELEQYIPETDQIADIFIEFNNGVKWAVEYQRSNIPTSEIMKRKKLYNQVNIRDIWVVGENVIKEIGISTCSILNVGQALQHSFCGETSLVSFNPESNEVNIFRGLNSLNNRTFTYNKSYSYPLESIGFNLWGEIFCLDDYVEIKNRAIFDDYIEKSLIFSFNLEHLYKGEIPGYNFKLKTKELYDEIHDPNQIPEYTHIKITPPLDRIVPVEMKSINISGFFLYDHKDHSEKNQLVITGIRKEIWVEELNKRTTNNSNISNNFMENPVVQGTFIWSLWEIYEKKFQTQKEFHEDMDYSNKGQAFPFSLQMKRIKKYGLIKKEFNKEDNHKAISLEDCLLILMNIAKFPVHSKNILKVALKNHIILPEELELDFNLALLDNIVKRVKNYIPESEHYHGFYKEGIGIFQ
ncbi:competence protein CoiA [Neobacillus rhizophilus]|uniref:Competence protein n=1 Tax=Neobacillus rhizophilus TaxID=2833579 RepID=A0A942U4H1_9BACI|nr:competence protein CoiA family protein [Neobacillus rhizophilus]MBS4212692.1 hypothetical protein [Neobacillus rhizophilus]